MALGVGAYLLALGGRGLLDRLRPALHQDVLGAIRESMLARVIRERHARLALEALELLREAERRGEAHGAALAVFEPDRSHRHHNRTAGRGGVAERRGQVPAEDLIDVVGPADGHAAIIRPPPLPGRGFQVFG